MKVKLLRDSREGKTGETVEVSPERFAFLLSIEAVVKAEDAGEQAEAPKAAEEPKAEKKPEIKKQVKPAAKAETKKQVKPAAKKK